MRTNTLRRSPLSRLCALARDGQVVRDPRSHESHTGSAWKRSAALHGVKYYRASGASVLSRPEGALMCNLLEIVERVKETGLDAVLAHMGLRAEQLRALAREYGCRTDQQKK